MKGWLAEHEGKWHPITDVVDTGKPAHEKDGGNVYHLEGISKPVHQSKITNMKPPEKTKKSEDKIPGGLADNKKPSDFNPKSLKEGMKIESEHTSDKGIAKEISMDHLTEDPKYYKKLKTIEKQDHVEVAPDGKQEIVPGKEALKKDPKKRWSEIKKSLDNASAIMDIEKEMNPPEPEQPQQAPEQEQGAEQPEEQPQQEEQAPEQDVQPEQEQGAEDQGEEQPDQEESEQKIIQALKDEGYSDSEIAYIVHGHHAPERSETDAAKAKATTDMSDLDLDHTKKLSDLEHSHTQRMNDLEYESKKQEMPDSGVEKDHRKRMLDVEYETTQQKKEEAKLELEHKKRMLDLEYQRAKHDAEKPDMGEDAKQRQLEFDIEMSRKEKELELEFKKKELELKLKLQSESAKQKAELAAKQAEEDHKVNAAAKKEQGKHKIAMAKQPPAQPKKGAKNV